MPSEKPTFFFDEIPGGENAACRTLEPAEFDRVFMGEDTAGGVTAANITKKAKAICEGCPVTQECLNRALEKNDIWLGVRGGKAHAELMALRAVRRRSVGDRSRTESLGTQLGRYIRKQEQ